MNLGESIKFVRTIAGMTQGEMAETLDVTGTYLSLIENGKTTPSLSLLDRIESQFGVPKSFLLWNSRFTEKAKDSAISDRYRQLGEQMVELATTMIRRATSKE